MDCKNEKYFIFSSCFAWGYNYICFQISPQNARGYVFSNSHFRKVYPGLSVVLLLRIPLISTIPPRIRVIVKKNPACGGLFERFELIFLTFQRILSSIFRPKILHEIRGEFLIRGVLNNNTTEKRPAGLFVFVTQEVISRNSRNSKQTPDNHMPRVVLFLGFRFRCSSHTSKFPSQHTK